MEKNNLVLVEQFCIHCDVEISFINSLHEYGLIEIIVLDDKEYITEEHLKDLERTIHFHNELNINLEGIDVIYNLLKQIDDLQQQLNIAKNKLSLLDLD